MVLEKNVSRIANLGNIVENAYAVRIDEDYECFWKNASLFFDVLFKLTGQSSVPGSMVITLYVKHFACKRGLSLTLFVGQLQCFGFRTLQNPEGLGLRTF